MFFCLERTEMDVPDTDATGDVDGLLCFINDDALQSDNLNSGEKSRWPR